MLTLRLDCKGRLIHFTALVHNNKEHVMKVWYQPYPGDLSQSGSKLYKVVSFTVVNKDWWKELTIMLRTSVACTNELTHRLTKGARRLRRWDKEF